jgi:hypothetical protein
LLLQSSQVLSHKPSLALVVAVVVLVAAQAVALAAIVQVVAVVVMAPAHALNHALVVAVAVVVMLVVVVQAIPVQRVQQTHVLHVLPTPVPLDQQVHALLNQRLAANVGTLAVAKNDSP